MNDDEAGKLSVQHSRPSIVKISYEASFRRLSGSRFLPEPAAAGIVALPIDCKGHDVLLYDFRTHPDNLHGDLAHAAA
jgi:hypothetical protein